MLEQCEEHPFFQDAAVALLLDVMKSRLGTADCFQSALFQCGELRFDTSLEEVHFRLGTRRLDDRDEVFQVHEKEFQSLLALGLNRSSCLQSGYLMSE